MPKVKRGKFSTSRIALDPDYDVGASAKTVTALEYFYTWQDDHPQVEIVSVIEKDGLQGMDIIFYYKEAT